MTGRKEAFPMVKRIVQLYAGDWERLQRAYGGTVRCSKAIRMIVHKHLNALDAKVAAREQNVDTYDEITS